MPSDVDRRGRRKRHVLAALGSASSDDVVRRQQLTDAGDGREAQHAPGSSSLGSARRRATRLGDGGDAALEHAGDVEQPDGSRAAPRSTSTQGVGVVERPVERRRRAGRRTRSGARPTGRPCVGERGGLQRHGDDRARRRAPVEDDLAVPTTRPTRPAVRASRPSSSAPTSARRCRAIRQRSSGGVITVVISTTSSRAPYSSSSSTPWARPMLAKIRPTSPRGIIPMPISSRSLGVPARRTPRRACRRWR